MGKLQLALNRLIGYNKYEGLQLGIGLYTSPKLFKKFSFGGYVNYGFNDKSSKYGGSFTFTPGKNKENKFFVSLSDDVDPTGQVTFLDGINRRTSEVFGQYLTETMDAYKQVYTGAEFRFLHYFKAGSYYKYADVTPKKPYTYTDAFLPSNTFNLQEAEVKVKWIHKETFSISPVGRVSNGSKWPKLWINGAYGLIDNADNYQRLDAQVEQTIDYPSSMQTRIRFKGGKYFGDYNNTLLYSALGTHRPISIFIPNRFATMRPNEFASSEYLACFLSHSMPLFLNKKTSFKPTIELNTNAAFGTAPNTIQTIEKGYYESGVIFKNLFKSLIFRYGLSIHYRYGAYQFERDFDNWSFKLGLEFGF